MYHEEVKQNVKEALEYFEKEKEEPVKQENIDEMLEKLTGEYHRSTGCISLCFCDIPS